MFRFFSFCFAIVLLMLMAIPLDAGCKGCRSGGLFSRLGARFQGRSASSCSTGGCGAPQMSSASFLGEAIPMQTYGEQIVQYQAISTPVVWENRPQHMYQGGFFAPFCANGSCFTGR